MRGGIRYEAIYCSSREFSFWKLHFSTALSDRGEFFFSLVFYLKNTKNKIN